MKVFLQKFAIEVTSMRLQSSVQSYVNRSLRTAEIPLRNDTDIVFFQNIYHESSTIYTRSFASTEYTLTFPLPTNFVSYLSKYLSIRAG